MLSASVYFFGSQDVRQHDPARNDTIFAGRKANVDVMFEELQTLSFVWIKHCSRDCGLTWEKWVSFSFS
ncbi:hypothetical protein HanPSC8_Chr01g0024691 [Helianthus annuus]|nr:hypothetical protein HanPSC8_Chr01g0024691 [Helianthus annuus]